MLACVCQSSRANSIAKHFDTFQRPADREHCPSRYPPDKTRCKAQTTQPSKEENYFLGNEITPKTYEISNVSPDKKVYITIQVDGGIKENGIVKENAITNGDKKEVKNYSEYNEDINLRDDADEQVKMEKAKTIIKMSGNEEKNSVVKENNIKIVENGKKYVKENGVNFLSVDYFGKNNQIITKTSFNNYVNETLMNSSKLNKKCIYSELEKKAILYIYNTTKNNINKLTETLELKKLEEKKTRKIKSKRSNKKRERKRENSSLDKNGTIQNDNEKGECIPSFNSIPIPDGGEVTLTELREMATRQQHQIETQQQLLVAREQRLKYLKQQEGRSAQVTLEAERLRRLRERVEAQEAKLRRLRALRGQVDSSLMNAASLSTDLEAMRHLFSEKEKELVDAAAKVEALTRQLEEVRAGRGTGGRAPGQTNSGGDSQNQQHLQIHQQELDKLRRELLYRNSVNREASSRVASQREALSSRKEEIARIDKRIAELQQRLYRKRFLNQQLASQISAATQAKQAQLKAVHLKAKREGKQDNSADDIMTEEARTLEDLAQFERGNQDPKYQTLPYNTKFSSGGRGPPEGPHSASGSGVNASHGPPTTTGAAPSVGVVTRTVHSIPTHLPAKGHASAPSNSGTTAGVPGLSHSANSSGAPTTHSVPGALHPGRAPQHTSSTRSSSSLQQPQQQLQQQQPQPHQHHFPAKVHSTEESSTSSNKVTSAQHQHHQQQQQQQQSQQQQLQHNQNTSSSQDHRSNLPPTSLSVSFAQKLNQGLKPGGQSRGLVLPSVHHSQPHNKDVENVRALGFPAGSTTGPSVSTKGPTNGTVSTEDEAPDSTNTSGKVKPILPPKPTPPSKPTPPPRQKGDPMAGSTESLNFTGISRHNGQSRPQVFRYASQNVILSTYTQQQQDQKQPEQKQVDQKPQQSHVSPQQDQQQLQVHHQNSTSNSNSGSSSLSQQQLTKEVAKSAISGLDSNSNGGDAKEYNGREGFEAPATEKVHISINRRIEMPPDFLFPEDAAPPSDLLGRQLSSGVEDTTGKNDPSSSHESSYDTTDRVSVTTISNEVINNNVLNTVTNFNNNISSVNSVNVALKEIEKLKLGGSKDLEKESAKESKGSNSAPFSVRVEDLSDQTPQEDKQEKDDDSTEDSSTGGLSSSNSVVVRRLKKGNLKNPNVSRVPRRVSFDPLALLLDASLEGELELVKRTATEVPNPSAANDEGITALHNAICAGHLDIVTFLVTFGCDVNAQDSDGWTPLHCAASCNNVAMVRFLVEHGACVLATTLSDHETAAEKCEQDEEGYDGCSQYLYSVQEKLGIMNGGVVYAVYDYEAQNDDELSLKCGDSITVLRRGDEYEREWWWAAKGDKTGYVPRNLLGLYPRVKNIFKDS